MKLSLSILFLFVFLDSFCPVPKRIKHIGYVEVGHISQPDYLLQSIVHVESGGDSLAYNKKERAAGILQIRPVMVRDANRILRQNGSKLRFKLKDRFNPSKSIQIYYIIQSHYKPANVFEYTQIWNGTSRKRDYYNKVVSQLSKLL